MGEKDQQQKSAESGGGKSGKQTGEKASDKAGAKSAKTGWPKP